MPFTHIDGHSRLHVRLEQLPENDFCLIQGFRYEVPGGEVVYEVRAGQRTDLASVPFFLAWFISSYGRHTLAAILHDYLWRERRADVALREANRVFRIALYELQIPFVRRWLMWTAVSLAAVMMKGVAWKVRVGSWLLAILVLDILTVWALTKSGASANTAFLAAGCLAAVVLLLWPHLEIAAVGAPTVYLLIPAIVLVLGTILFYRVTERVAYAIGQTWRRIAPSVHRTAPAPLNPPVIDKSSRQRADSRAMVRGV